jgi:hypothetical protein
VGDGWPARREDGFVLDRYDSCEFSALTCIEPFQQRSGNARSMSGRE